MRATFVVPVILLSSLALAAQEAPQRRAVERFLQADGRPCARFSDGEVECLQYPAGYRMAAEIRDGHVVRAGRVATKGFWLATAAMAAATVLDVESSKYAFGHNPYSYEHNPIFGSRHPTRLRFYSIMGAITGAEVVGMYYEKKWPNSKGFRDRAWVAIPAAHIGAHAGFAATWNYLHAGRP